MIRKYIIEADDSIKGFNEEIARLEREWGAEEIEPCNNCVSKQDVNKLVDELARAISDERCCCMSRGRSTASIMQNIIDLPTVTPSRPRGKWIFIESDCEDCYYNDGEIHAECVDCCAICDMKESEVNRNDNKK